MASPRPEGHPTNRLRRLAFLAPVLLALLLPSCGSDTSTLPDVFTAVMQVTVTPNPVIGVQNPLTGSVTASYKITIEELNGLGGEVDFVSSTIFNPSTGLQVALTYYDSTDLTVFVGSKRVEPKGTLVVPQSTTYTLPDLTRATNVTVSVQMKDDRGNLHYQALLVPIQ